MAAWERKGPAALERVAQVGFQRRARAEMIVERLGRDRAGFGLTVDVNGEAQLRRRVLATTNIQQTLVRRGLDGFQRTRPDYSENITIHLTFREDFDTGRCLR